MVISTKLLNKGERIVLSTRTHVKALFLPVVVLLLVNALAGYLTSLPNGDHAAIWRWVIWVVAALVLLRYVVVPFLHWMFTSYTFTNRRLITRTGILTRTGHDIPMNRISDISYEKDLVDRIFGCGTLIVSDASERGQVMLKDIPRAEEAQLAVSEELFSGSGRDDATTDDGS